MSKVLARRQSNRQSSVFFCFLLLACCLLAACHKPPGSQDIRMALAQAPLNLDPRYAVDAASARVNRLLYRPLVEFDDHYRPVPALASWQQRTPLQYRFTLGSEGRVFHDGTHLTANDVAATYRALLASRDSPIAAEFSNIATIKVINDDTLDFQLAAPDDLFPARLIVGIMPAHLLAQHHDFAHLPVGSGPLKFVSWHGSLRLRRTSDRQGFTLHEVKDPTVRVLKLLHGETDLLQGDLPPELVKYLKSQSDIKVATGYGTNFSYLGFNMQDPQLRIPAVRQAIAYAIDREEIVRQALVPDSRIAGAILPPEHWAGNAALSTYAYNPQYARQLLNEAGIKLPLRLSYKTSTDAQRVRLATILQAQMQPAGIELLVQSLDWGTFFDDVRQGSFQLYGLTWVGIKTPDIYRLAFHSASVPPKGANRGQLDDKTLDAMIDKRDWQAVTARVHQTLPYVPLWYEGQFVAMRRGLVDYRLQPDGNWDGLVTIRKCSQPCK